MTPTDLPAGAAVGQRHPVWHAAVPAEQAVRKVARRLAHPVDLTARLYHHPFLGVVFVCRPLPSRLPRLGARRSGRAAAPVAAHVVVDLVSGRAYLSDPWDDESFTTREAALAAAGPDSAAEPTRVRGPEPRISEQDAVTAARALLAGALTRRRRLDPLGPAELHTDPIRFGKPNWWVTGELEGRPVEVIVDALSGRHYVCSG